MERLSYDNVFEILLTLLRRGLNYGDDEEKELVRCMCVSKLWYRVISDILRLVLWSNSPITGLYYIRSTTLKPNSIPFALHTASRSNHTTHYATTADRFLYDSRPITDFFFIDCCNGLLLIFDIIYDTYFVCNPYTRRRIDIPKPHHHHHHHHHCPFAKNILCVALAYDPLESSFYKVVIITATATATTTATCNYNNNDQHDSNDDFEFIDIFSSRTGEWNRTTLKLDPFFIRDSFSRYTVPRVYFHRVLYRISSSLKLSCVPIDNNKGTTTIDLPAITDDSNVGMGCLGVSMSRTTACLLYCRRERTTYRVWLCHVDDGNEWIPTYTISIEQLKTRCTIGLFISDDDILLMEPCAIGTNPCVMFFGIRGTIFSYNFKTNVLKLVHETPVVPDNSSCFSPVFTFRACLLPFQGLDKRNIISSTPSSHSHQAFSRLQMGWWKSRLWADENESATKSFLNYFVYSVF
ncbi:uncharacterized protein LOC133783089 [Humulus lupulus]|uniref:uncharacterized protein LOC133783089 n=1 Tax=Humulus lupulus TaxID=3486 RepID=UPI002B406D07|nr:uncharacterized protein LOC133783089 [Humulus lupulus]